METITITGVLRVGLDKYGNTTYKADEIVAKGTQLVFEDARQRSTVDLYYHDGEIKSLVALESIESFEDFVIGKEIPLNTEGWYDVIDLQDLIVEYEQSIGYNTTEIPEWYRVVRLERKI